MIQSTLTISNLKIFRVTNFSQSFSTNLSKSKHISKRFYLDFIFIIRKNGRNFLYGSNVSKCHDTHEVNSISTLPRWNLSILKLSQQSFVSRNSTTGRVVNSLEKHLLEVLFGLPLNLVTSVSWIQLKNNLRNSMKTRSYVNFETARVYCNTIHKTKLMVYFVLSFYQ